MAKNTTVKRSTIAKAEERRISNIGDIKARMGGIIELPSGIVIRWRNPGGIRAFMSGGKIPNALLGTVEQTMKGGKGVDQESMTQKVIDQLEENPEMMEQLMALYDDVAIKCFVEPKLYRDPTDEDVDNHNSRQTDPGMYVESPEDLRKDDRLYVSDIPDDDKAYLFKLLSGGVADLATFRAERNIDVDNLAAVSGVVGHSVDDNGTDAG